MLLSKLDQRCEAAFVHIRTESGECGGVGVRDEQRCLWTDNSLSLLHSFSFFVSPLQSLSLLLSLLPSEGDLLCVEYIICQRLFHIRPGLIYQ